MLKTLLPKDMHYEKKLPYGRFFSLFPWLVKILNLIGNTFNKFILRTNYILLFCKFVIKKNKIVYYRHAYDSAKNLIAKGLELRKKAFIRELFFVLNMAIGRSFDRINFDIIPPVFDIT